MPRRRDVPEDKYIHKCTIEERLDGPSITDLALKLPELVMRFDKEISSVVKQAQFKPDWSLYRASQYLGNPYIMREMCDRCGQVWVPPGWRKIRAIQDEDLGTVYFETGLCKSCINASAFMDKYLDGEPLTEQESHDEFERYAMEYERAWRVLLAAAPPIIMTEAEWQHRLRFFNGCAFCGAPVDTRAKFFPTSLNGTFSPWNVIPLCSKCMQSHYMSRNNPRAKTVARFKVFCSIEKFNKLKTTRMFLIEQMRHYNLYIEPMIPYMQRFREAGTLEGSVFNVTRN